MPALTQSAPSEVLGGLEAELMAASGLTVAFRSMASGAFSADLEGELELGEGGSLRLVATGSFGGEAVALSLTVQEGRMWGGGPGGEFDQPAPPEVREAVVLGLTRMGLLHNLARLTAGLPPDHAEGGVAAWVETHDVGWTPDSSVAGRQGLAFELRVAGTPSGDAVLWLDAQGRPIVRDLTVSFPGGEMHVRERYEVR